MTKTQARHAIDARSTWRTFFERDLDLILLDQLHSSEAFRSWLLERIAPDLVRKEDLTDFSGAWHSVIDSLGHESDIEAEWACSSGGRFTLLIEDKIDARCEPDQAARYRARAARYVAEGRSTQALTLLIAPSGYPLRYQDDTAAFETFLAIEEIAEWIENAEGNARGEYLVRMLRHALSRWRSSGGEDRRGGKPTFSEIYEVIHEELVSGSGQLSISNSTPGAWVYFAFDGRHPGTSLRYRIQDHWTELVLRKARVDENALASVLEAHPLPRAALTSRGETELAVWISTPELDLTADGASQRDRIRAALATVDSLRRWYVHHAGLLHR